MKKSLLVLVLPLLLVFGCKKKDEPVCADVVASVPPSQITALRAYIANNNITAEEDPRGFFFRIEAAGSARKPTPCSSVTVDYTGRLTTGGTFDSNPNATFSLNSVITGWRLGVPMIGEGGKIILYLPPALGYGSSPAGSIPPNSTLIFTIELKKVN
ncbi:FKBP-type peptidyl-prolyl cis-trans isomerase [Aridibaculum aurantiacum]|uniref:FKBP-type peptidyl-prolyl cis-trans isomerase n=1 Tax=Aridibaculum aurantiacum TaxID=2810307 RepID=UPI001A959186|nr:FKBP-type peptidyl-prolyl cis-trans isomerase [Aridibaculum aurantiacum]